MSVAELTEAPRYRNPSEAKAHPQGHRAPAECCVLTCHGQGVLSGVRVRDMEHEPRRSPSASWKVGAGQGISRLRVALLPCCLGPRRTRRVDPLGQLLEAGLHDRHQGRGARIEHLSKDSPRFLDLRKVVGVIDMM